MQINWKFGVVASVIAGIIFGAGMTTGARIERTGTDIEWRAAINSCQSTTIGEFEIIPDKTCTSRRPVNFLYLRAGNIPMSTAKAQ